MSKNPDQALLDALLDSWDRNNTILINLVRALPEGGLEARGMGDSPSAAELFAHIHYVRLVLISENAPEYPVELPDGEWRHEHNPERIAQLLAESGQAVRDVLESKIIAGQNMKVHYDHPILFLHHMIWHDAYHHGQIKLALKASRSPNQG